MEEELLSPREIRRYKKQIMLPEIGMTGQGKLKKSSVAVIGAGGLGCPVLQYLVAAGVGKVALIEFDMVSEENLQRQLLYGSNDVGKLKSVIARDRLLHLNCMASIEIINLRLDASNSLRILKDYEIIVDATDNTEARYIINDSCVILGKPMVHGAIYKYEGQVSVFNYRNGPTYRCYNPRRGGAGFKNPLPADVGIIGTLPGITGTFMAGEVIKIITGSGNILSGKMLLFNIMNYSFHIIKIKNVPANHDIKTMNDLPFSA